MSLVPIKIGTELGFISTHPIDRASHSENHDKNPMEKSENQPNINIVHKIADVPACNGRNKKNHISLFSSKPI